MPRWSVEPAPQLPAKGARPLAVIRAHRGSVERAWRRSAARYTSARLRHLNPGDGAPEEWDGPDGERAS